MRHAPRLALLALLLSVCGGAWGQSYWSLTTDNANLIERWNGDANADSTGDANGVKGVANGTWTGGAAYEAGPTGKGLGLAFRFSGTNVIAAGNVAPFPNGADFTACFWVKDVGSIPDMNDYWFSQSTGIGNGWAIRRGGASDAAVQHYVGNSGLVDAGTRTVDVWHHIAIVYDASEGEVLLYQDGVELSTRSVTVENQGTILTIGGRNGGSPFAASTVAIFDPRVYSSGLAEADIGEIKAGPEPHYTSGATLAPDGTLDVGEWNAYSNGSVTYEWVVAKSDGTVVDAGTGDTDTATGLTPGTLYLYVRASNDGGYDVGDHGEREGAYGEANDGYYEVASVTVPAPNYLNRTRYPWWLRRGAIDTPQHYACRTELLGLAA